jgi:hypothetical protein
MTQTYFYNQENGHYYSYVTRPGISWTTARSLAEQMNHNGLEGYLATITTASEMNFVDQVVFGNGRPDNTFVGGSDEYEEGVWRWVTGPEGNEEGGYGRTFYKDGSFVGEPAANWINYSQGDSASNDYLYIYSYWQPSFNPWNGSLGSPGAGGNEGFLVEFGSLSASVAGSIYSGAPLTGIIQGTEGNDQYIGAVDGNPAIVEADIFDSGGDDVVQAKGAHTGELIKSSKFNFNESYLSFFAEMSGGYYGKTIFNSEILTGPRGSDIAIASIEQNGIGFNWFTAAADGLKVVGGSGADNLKFTVINIGEDAFSLRSSDIHLGSGNDYLEVTLDATAQASVAIFNTFLDLGDGRNQVVVTSTQKGIYGSNIKSGDGNNTLQIYSDLHGLVDSHVNLGVGSDRVIFNQPNDFNYSILNSTVELGAGDDEITLGSALNSFLSGGDGVDTLKLLGGRSEFTITESGLGYIIQGAGQSASNFRITDFEFVQFDDLIIELAQVKMPFAIVEITGSAIEDQNLTAVVDLLDEKYVLERLIYQWKSDGFDIFGETSNTLKLDQSEVSKVITVVVSYTDDGGTIETVISAATSAVRNVNDDPTGSVTITGTAIQGNELVAVTTTLADDDGLGILSYQWKADGVNINGATASSYVLTHEDVGSQIKLSVSYTDGQGTNEIVSSDQTAPVEAAPVIAPAFDMLLTSTSGNIATFEIYATAVADSGDPGLEDFQFTLSHNVSDLTIDLASVKAAAGLTAFPNLDFSGGTLTFGGFALPPFTDLSTPILTFNATIHNEDVPFNVTIDNIIADNTNLPRVVEQFDFSSIEVTTTVTDRFGNSLSNADVSAYEVQVGEYVFLREVSTSDTSSVFEIVAKPTEAVSSVDFELLDFAGLVDFQVGSALNGWSIQSNTITPDVVQFAGFGAVNGSTDLLAGQEVVLATFETSQDPDFVIDGIFLNTTAQADISVGEVTAVSKAGNVTVHEVARGSDIYLDADKPIDLASDRAITANDALQALRLAVGLTKSDGTAVWHDYIAADINKDGQVTANDALNILKFAVGLTDGPSADWVFVDGDADWSTIGRRNTSYEEGNWLEDVVADMSVNMTAILVGDVNGSYVA